MSADREAVRRQRAELKLTMPLFDGRGLRQSYAVEGTPKLMVIDADGMLRGAWVGWGEETREAVLKECASGRRSDPFLVSRCAKR